ncbi:MAG TPA: hypothetical protein VKU02_08290 [Gemmataceae bacterium]|nr:hypothetical protein [Gemmataceae bacterium]
MPANKGGESKQGLVIFLVVFVLLTLILGVTTYYGYAGQAELQKAAADSKKDAESAKKDREWYKFVALQLKGYTGDLTKQENEELAVSRERYLAKQLTGGDDQAAIDNLFKDLQARLAKDATTIEPYRQRVARLEEELKNTRASLQAEKNTLAKERAEHATLIAVKEAELQEAKTNYQKAQSDYVALQQKMAQELSTRLQEFGNISDELAKSQKKASTDVGNLEKEKNRLLSDIKDQNEAREKLERKLTPPDLQKFSAPKGKVVDVDLRGQLAWINLGSADNIRTQQGLTFSIFGSGVAGRGSNEPKGALEVVEVRGPHLSMAKITSTADPRNNPIQPGDLLVNPAWSPTMQQHVAIAGLIDITGDGRDQLDEFMRALARQNIIVDAYLDLKEAAVKGKIDLKTDYLILGDQPEFTANTPIREGDPRFERKIEIRDKIAAMQTDAQRLGVTIVPLRRFVALIGYQLPRGARSTSGFGYDSQIPSRAANGEAKEGGKKEKAKEEKKDEGK